ncbi:DUF4097 family beta strand repeat-containing protein [Pseudidiomarina salilacus]|uniref:hypothetical protein n=1 Tax=Pseudidiomarina salilacus TaxID=3384452 RepID=UPI0039855F37
MMQRQQGAATVLILLLVGLAVVASVLIGLRQISTAQDKATALHAQSQAQMKAWRGAELLYRYFQQVAVTEGATWDAIEADLLNAISTTNASEGDILNGDPAAFIRAVATPDPAVDEHFVTIDVVATSGAGGPAQATSTLRLVYLLASVGGTPGGAPALPAVINFNRNLELRGNIDVIAPEDEPYVINVRGDLTTRGNSISGIDTINADGSIEIGSGSRFNKLNANGDIKLTGSVSGEQNLSALGDICLTGGASANGEVKANGSVTGSGGVQYGAITALGESDNLLHTLLCSPINVDYQGDKYAVDLMGNSSAQSVKAGASVKLNSGTIGSLQAEGDLVTTNWGGNVQGSIGGTFHNGGNPANDARINIQPGLDIGVEPLDPIIIETGAFNAYQYESEANYIFRYLNNQLRVEVKNVSGIPDGLYYLGDNTSVNGPKRDRLCVQGNCKGDSYPFCVGYSDWNGCFSYNRQQQRLDIGGRGMAPGVVMIEGNLKIGNGTYFNTFIITGNVQTAGQHKNYAPNYAGYDGEIDNVTYAPRGICANAYVSHHPTQFCKSDGSFDAEASNGIGNYTYMVGSEVSGNYNGGDIDFGASTENFGNVLAGNEFNSAGSSTIYGFISALAQGAETQNRMGGSTTIDVEGLPPTFDPFGGGVGPGNGNGGGGSTGGAVLDRVVLLWSRYL